MEHDFSSARAGAVGGGGSGDATSTSGSSSTASALALAASSPAAVAARNRVQDELGDLIFDVLMLGCMCERRFDVAGGSGRDRPIPRSSQPHATLTSPHSSCIKHQLHRSGATWSTRHRQRCKCQCTRHRYLLSASRWGGARVCAPTDRRVARRGGRGRGGEGEAPVPLHVW